VSGCARWNAVIANSRVRHRHDCGGRLRRHSVHRGDRRLDRERADQHHREGVEHQRLRGAAGGATVEAAFAIAALSVVLVVCLGGASAMSMQVRCIDSAREAARLAARGDERAATEAARRIGPAGAILQLRDDGDFVVARVSAKAPLSLGFFISAEAVAAREPGA